MQEISFIFGVFLRQERQAKNISLWQMALQMRYHIRNLQRIEKGERQPGVNLAIRMLDSLEIPVGSFMGKLAADNIHQLPESISPLERVEISYQKPIMDDGMKSLFGPLLMQARVAGAVSQTAMSKASGYHLRNINAVEKGKQEPGIMTALALVMTTGVNVCGFFDCLYMYWKESS